MAYFVNKFHHFNTSMLLRLYAVHNNICNNIVLDLRTIKVSFISFTKVLKIITGWLGKFTQINAYWNKRKCKLEQYWICFLFKGAHTHENAMYSEKKFMFSFFLAFLVFFFKIQILKIFLFRSVAFMVVVSGEKSLLAWWHGSSISLSYFLYVFFLLFIFFLLFFSLSLLWGVIHWLDVTKSIFLVQWPRKNFSWFTYIAPLPHGFH